MGLRGCESDILADIADSLRRIADSLALVGAARHTGSMDAAPVVAVGAAVSIDEAVARWRDELTSRGVRPSSVTRFRQLTERVSKSQGWNTIADVNYLSAVAFLSARRRGENGGKEWGPSTYNQCVTVLRTFGEFLRRAKYTTVNPLDDLQTWKQAGGDGCRALKVDEARAVIRVALARQNDARAHGFAALFWHTLAMTGLRYSELCSLAWGDVHLDQSRPCIRLRPNAHGNKAARADYIGLHAESSGLLKQWRTMVPSGVRDAVFPIVPTRTTWRQDRDDAGIKAVDERGRKTSVHCLRKTFCTLIDVPGAKSGLVAACARHKTTLTEKRYIDHEEGELWELVQTLPCLWPPDGGDKWKKSSGLSAGLARPPPIRYSDGATDEHNPFTSAVPRDASPNGGHRSHFDALGGASRDSALSEPRDGGIEAAFGLRPVTPITDHNLPDAATDEVALALAQWLRSRLQRGSRKGATGGEPHQQHPA